MSAVGFTFDPEDCGKIVLDTTSMDVAGPWRYDYAGRMQINLSTAECVELFRALRDQIGQYVAEMETEFRRYQAARAAGDVASVAADDPDAGPQPRELWEDWVDDQRKRVKDGNA